MALIPWVDVFVDVPAAAAGDFRSFWSGVTGWPVSEPRGDREQFRSLLPDPEGSGRAYLRVQELEGPPRVHLDLVSADLAVDAERLAGLGASPVDSLDGVEILSSPAGQIFCLVHDDEPRPVVDATERSRTWPGGHRSRLTHVCLDVPPAAYDEELAFWVAATGWRAESTRYPEFSWVMPPAGVPLALLVQRLARPDDVVGAHLDLGCTDLPAEVARLRDLGAVDEGPLQSWHVLRDPVLGLPFCATVTPP